MTFCLVIAISDDWRAGGRADWRTGGSTDQRMYSRVDEQKVTLKGGYFTWNMWKCR